MIGILIAIGVFIITLYFSVQMARDLEGGVGRYVNATILSLLVAFVVGAGVDLILFTTFNFAACDTVQATEVVSSYEIVALQDNSSANGEYFLGCGSTNGNEYYAVYAKTDNGFQYKSIDADDWQHPAYVNYTDIGETPHVDQYAIVRRQVYKGCKGGNPLLVSVIAYWMYGDCEPGDVVSTEIRTPAVFVDSDDYFDNFRYEIFVPNGSVVQDYTLDLN